MNSKKFFLLVLSGVLAIASPLVFADESNSVVPTRKNRPRVDESTIKEGKKIYRRSCSTCHGQAGKGDGTVSFFMNRQESPHPRDFTAGVYKFRSTRSGELPLDEDLFRVVTNGVRGFMPSYAGLKVADRWKVIYYIKSLYPDFEDYPPEPLTVEGHPVPFTAASVRKGYQVFQAAGCWECHGSGGEGDGPKALTLKDDWNHRIRPASLTIGNTFKNGSNPEDLYRTIIGGLDGTPMAAYEGAFPHEEDIWHLINFIYSLSQHPR